MRKYLGPFAERIYALMRIVVGFLFACHGAQKLFGVLGGTPAPLFTLQGVSGIIEFGAGVLVAVGLLASCAAFVASGEMAVAYFMVHFPNGFWPIENHGELAALYSFVFLYIAAHGSGTWSLASALRKPILS